MWGGIPSCRPVSNRPVVAGSTPRRAPMVSWLQLQSAAPKRRFIPRLIFRALAYFKCIDSRHMRDGQPLHTIQKAPLQSSCTKVQAGSKINLLKPIFVL